MNFNGIYPPVITPHLDDGSIDRDGFATVVEFSLSNGVHGIIVGGTTGEYYAQTREERVELMHLASELVNKRYPLIAGVASRQQRSQYLRSSGMD